MGHLKALNYPDYPVGLSADNPVTGYLKNGTIRHSLQITDVGFKEKRKTNSFPSLDNRIWLSMSGSTATAITIHEQGLTMYSTPSLTFPWYDDMTTSQEVLVVSTSII